MSWNTDTPIGQIVTSLPGSTGRYYDSRISTSYTTFTLVANTLYAVPFLAERTTTYTTIALEVSTLASSKSVRLGIYTDGGGVPNALILDAGTVSTTTTGAKTISISQVLSANWYWLAAVSDGTPGLRAISQTAIPMLGASSGTDTTIHVGWSVSFTYAALPNPFTGGGALMTTAAPRLMLSI